MESPVSEAANSRDDEGSVPSPSRVGVGCGEIKNVADVMAAGGGFCRVRRLSRRGRSTKRPGGQPRMRSVRGLVREKGGRRAAVSHR